MRSAGTRIWHHLTIAAAVCAAYYQVSEHLFVWDTIPFVLENPWLREWSLDNLIAMLTRAHAANWQPVVMLSHSIDFALFGDGSGGHHLVNVLLHLVNSWLLYWLILRILTLAGLAGVEAGWSALLTALIFSIHPQHVESVAWVVERKDLLYALFALLTLLSYLSLQTTRAPRARDRAAPVLLFCVALASKPMAVTLPVVLVLLDLYPLRRCAPALRPILAAVWEKRYYLAIAAAVAVITLVTQSQAMPGLARLPLWARALNAVDNTWFYAAHYLAPVALSPFYPFPSDPAALTQPGFWLPGSLLLLGLGAAVVLFWRRGVIWPSLLLIYYLVTLLPVIGLIQVGPAKATDHYTYLATIPLSLLTALAVAWLAARVASMRAVVVALAAFYVLCLLALTHQQVTYWRDPLTLWTRVTSLHPADPYARRNLAAVYVQMGDLRQALRHAELSVELGAPNADYLEKLREEIERREMVEGNR